MKMNIINAIDGIGMNISTGGGGTKDHSKLQNLDYEHSGHTGFQPAGDYATKDEVNAKYTKPSSGIPSSDIADGVIPVVPTDEEMIEVCSIIGDFITINNNYLGIDSNTVLEF